MDKPLRKYSNSVKKRVAARQEYRCANKNESKIRGLDNYCCPFNVMDKVFDESGYDIDHIEEFAESKNNDISNLQALCINCHRVKKWHVSTVQGLDKNQSTEKLKK